MKIRVGVIFGGESVEHEVSIISAITAMYKMDQEKYDIVPIYITKDNEWYTGEFLKDIESFKNMNLIKSYATNVVLMNVDGRFVLKKKKGLFNKIVDEIDIVFPITHGTNVEDGSLQGFLQTVGVPYVGPSVYAGVVGQDKVYMKAIFEKEGLPITKYVWFYDTDFKKDQEKVIEKVKKLKYPVIVKPSLTGSSIGIGVASNDRELIESINEAIEFDGKIVVEEIVGNLKEVNIAVLGNYENQKVSEIEEIKLKSEFLTYQDKYVGDGTIQGGKKLGFKTPVKGPVKGGKTGMPSASKIPADLSDKLRKEVERVAIEAFKALGTSGNSRIDFLIDEKEEKVYVNEINSIPGSLAYYLWEGKGIEFTEVLNDMINIGVRDYKRRTSKTHSFDSNILSNYTSNGVKGVKGTKGKLQK